MGWGLAASGGGFTPASRESPELTGSEDSFVEMVNDSIQASHNSVELFDQDSYDQDSDDQDSVHDTVQGSFVAALEAGRDGSCQECHVGNCGNCSDPVCRCPHPFVVIGRAIVELDGSLQRTNDLLKKIERSSTATQQVIPIGSEDPRPVAPVPHVPAKARRGLGRKKSNR